MRIRSLRRGPPRLPGGLPHPDGQPEPEGLRHPEHAGSDRPAPRRRTGYGHDLGTIPTQTMRIWIWIPRTGRCILRSSTTCGWPRLSWRRCARTAFSSKDKNRKEEKPLWSIPAHFLAYDTLCPSRRKSRGRGAAAGAVRGRSPQAGGTLSMFDPDSELPQALPGHPARRGCAGL